MLQLHRVAGVTVTQWRKLVVMQRDSFITSSPWLSRLLMLERVRRRRLAGCVQLRRAVESRGWGGSMVTLKFDVNA